MANISVQKVVVKHNTIANRTFTHDSNTMVECVPFSNLGKIQPFLISLSSTAALLMDFHCHLTKSEVSGYLAGHWDVNSHSLHITHAFPCRTKRLDRENCSQVEVEISKLIEKEKLTLLGWYHSHPFTPAAPTLRDIDAQLDYQIRMKGSSDNNYLPCIGIIISPYNMENTSLESSMLAYWVIPPPESKPNEYGRPMLMSYSVVQDSLVTNTIKEDLKKCVDYYRSDLDFITFSDIFFGTTTFADKLKSTLISKLQREQNELPLWNYIKELLNISSEDKDNVLSIPSVSKNSQMLMNLNSSLNLNPNLMVTSDIASVLFNTGKFPSASSILGLPDPMAHSTLAANNMFLQSNLFKMQDLLKPLSTSSPISTPKLKSELKSSPSLKIPNDNKTSSKVDFATDLNILSFKNKLEFSNSDLFTGKSKSDISFSDLSSNIISATKEFSSSDLNLSSVKNLNSDFGINLSKTISNDSLERPSKIAKTDFTLDLSQKKFLSNFPNIPSDLSVTASSEEQSASNLLLEDQPLNLHSDT